MHGLWICNGDSAMSMRTSLEASERLPAVVGSLRDDANSIKVNQRVGGTGMVTYVTRRTTTTDWMFTLTSAQLGQTTVIFTAKQQQWAFARLMYQVFYNDQTTEIRPSHPKWPMVSVTPLWADPAQPYVSRWKVTLVGPVGSTNTYYLKWWVESSDGGAITQ